MELDELWLWEFDKDPTSKEDEIECPECKKYSKINDWEEGNVYCECCGEHDSLNCPECFEPFDSVRGPIFRVKKKSKGALKHENRKRNPRPSKNNQ